jgi:hypothetical protein
MFKFLFQIECNLYQLCFCMIAGPDLPKATMGAAMVPTPDGTGVVLIGGWDTWKDLHELKCTTGGCYWSLMAQHLSVSRHRHIAFYVPDSFAVCEQSVAASSKSSKGLLFTLLFLLLLLG